MALSRSLLRRLLCRQQEPSLLVWVSHSCLRLGLPLPPSLDLHLRFWDNDLARSLLVSRR